MVLNMVPVIPYNYCSKTLEKSLSLGQFSMVYVLEWQPQLIVPRNKTFLGAAAESHTNLVTQLKICTIYSEIVHIKTLALD